MSCPSCPVCLHWAPDNLDTEVVAELPYAIADHFLRRHRRPSCCAAMPNSVIRFSLRRRPPRSSLPMTMNCRSDHAPSAPVRRMDLSGILNPLYPTIYSENPATKSRGTQQWAPLG